MFEFEAKGIKLGVTDSSESIIGIKNIQQISEADIENAKKVSEHFYGSTLWKKFKSGTGQEVGLDGYVEALLRGVMKNETAENIKKTFHTAHTLKYVTIYKDDSMGMLYIKEGEKACDVEKNKYCE